MLQILRNDWYILLSFGKTTLDGHQEYTSCVAGFFTNVHETDTESTQAQNNFLMTQSAVPFWSPHTPTVLGSVENGVATA